MFSRRTDPKATTIAINTAGVPAVSARRASIRGMRGITDYLNYDNYVNTAARQLTELVTMLVNDGDGSDEALVEVFELWLDGASGSDTVQTFDWAAFRD